LKTTNESQALSKSSIQYGYRVGLAYDSETGFTAWKVRHHDLILQDLALPGVSGAEVLQRVLRINRKQSVIILTAHATTDRHTELVLTGMVDFLATPFKVEELCRACESVLHHRHFLDTCQQFQESESLLQGITGRLYAADRCLSVGKAWDASHHVKSALTNCRNVSPNDEEWARIIAEFDL
jgi:DNA-binding response OmpR family regulator